MPSLEEIEKRRQQNKKGFQRKKRRPWDLSGEGLEALAQPEAESAVAPAESPERVVEKVMEKVTEKVAPPAEPKVAEKVTTKVTKPAEVHTAPAVPTVQPEPIPPSEAVQAQPSLHERRVQSADPMPTPLPANRPMRCPRPIEVRALIARTPTSSGSRIGVRLNGLISRPSSGIT